MATSYTVMPITNEVIVWLKKKGIDYSGSAQGGRFPSPNELRKVLDSLDGCTTQYTINPQTWQAVISDAENRWASIVVLGYKGDEGEDNTHHEFYFEKGWQELMARILKELALSCGPFVLAPTADLEPVLIISTPGARNAK